MMKFYANNKKNRKKKKVKAYYKDNLNKTENACDGNNNLRLEIILNRSDHP